MAFHCGVVAYNYVKTVQMSAEKKIIEKIIENIFIINNMH